MAYEKYEWQRGEIVTSDKLNNMENSISNVSDEIDSLSDNLSAEVKRATAIENSTRAVPSVNMNTAKVIYKFDADVNYPLSQGFCIANDVIIVAKTTGTDTDPTKYIVINAATDGEILNETMLNTMHSNSLTYNPDTGKIICATNQNLYTLSIANDYSLSIDSTSTVSTYFSAITYADGYYYLYGEGYIWKSANLSDFEQLFPIEMSGYTSQGLTNDGNYLYYCTSGEKDNIIWVYTFTGILTRMMILSTNMYKELEEADFYNKKSLYVNISDSENGGGIYRLQTDNTQRIDIDYNKKLLDKIINVSEIQLSPNSSKVITIQETDLTTRWCALFETNGSSPNCIGAWLGQGYGPGDNRYVITPIHETDSISISVSQNTIIFTNSSSVTPILYIHWFMPVEYSVSN